MRRPQLGRQVEDRLEDVAVAAPVLGARTGLAVALARFAVELWLALLAALGWVVVIILPGWFRFLRSDVK